MRRYLASSRLLLLSATLALGIGLLVANQLFVSRTAIRQRAQEANSNLLFAVSYVLERTLRSADLSIGHAMVVLSQAGGQMAPEGLPGGMLGAAVSQGGVGLLLVLDHTGKVVGSSRPMASTLLAFADRDYFRVHQHNADVGLFISPPFASRLDGEPSIALSRRWSNADGSFGGIVVQTIKLAILQDLFAPIELGPDSGINLFLADGTIVMSFPYTSETTGASLAGTPDFERLMREKQGTFAGVALDQVERVYTYRVLHGYPLLISTAQSTESVLGPWRRNALWLAAATLVLMTGCLGLAGLAERELRAHRRTARRLLRAEGDTRTVLDSLPAMVGYWDENLRNRFSNVAHQRWFGLTTQQIQGRHISEVIGAPLYEKVKPYIDLTLAGETQVFEKTFADIRRRMRHTVSTYIPDFTDGRVRGFFVLVNDITERKAAEDNLSEEKERFRVTLEAIRDAVVTVDAEGRITYLNPAAGRMTGWPLEQAQGRHVNEVVRVEDLHDPGAPAKSAIHNALRRRHSAKSKAEHVLVSREGERAHIEDSASPIVDEQGQLLGAVMVFHNVTQARAIAHKMSHLAQHDGLTGLANTRRLRYLADRGIARATKTGRRMALLYLDLDGFKAINDTFGHAAGDELLITVTRRMSTALRKDDTLARMGGDEFVGLMDGLDDPAEAGLLASRLVRHCAEPVSVTGREVSVTVSIGISVFPDDGSDFETLVRHADQAMYRAKQAGRNQYAFFQREAPVV